MVKVTIEFKKTELVEALCKYFDIECGDVIDVYIGNFTNRCNLTYNKKNGKD